VPQFFHPVVGDLVTLKIMSPLYSRYCEAGGPLADLVSDPWASEVLPSFPFFRVCTSSPLPTNFDTDSSPLGILL